MEHTDIREKVIKALKLSAIVTQGSLTMDFSPIITPECDVRSRYCDLGLDGVIVWDLVDKDILEAPFRFLGVLDVYVHDDLYFIPLLGTGGAKLFESSIGLYLDNGYLLAVRNSTAAKTLSSIKTAKNYTDILELEKLVIENSGNENAIA